MAAVLRVTADGQILCVPQQAAKLDFVFYHFHSELVSHKSSLLNRLPQVSPDRTDEWRIAFAMLRFAQRGFDRDYLCRQVIQSTESQIATNLIVTGFTHFNVFPVRHAFRALSDYFHNSYFELQIQFRMIESPHFRPFGGQGRSVIVCLVFRHRPAAVVLADIPVATNGHTLFPESRNDLARVYGLADSVTLRRRHPNPRQKGRFDSSLWFR